MTLSQIFTFCMFYVSVFWSGMILFPNWSITRKVMKTYFPFIPLSLLFTYFLLTPEGIDALISGVNPQLSQYTKLFSQDLGGLSVTIHMLAMDLLAGRWIYWEGQEKGIWTRHSLIITIFAGPAGVLCHLITAYFFNKKNDDLDDDNSGEKKSSDTTISQATNS